MFKTINNKQKLIGLIILLFFSMYLSLRIGYTKGFNLKFMIDTITNFNSENMNQILFVTQRIPRMINALIVGSSLAMAGLLSQTLTKNKLASPNILAINSTATFFVLMSMIILPNINSRFIFAFIGSLIGLTLTISITKKIEGELKISTMIIIGMSISLIFSSLTQTIIYLNQQLSAQMSLWTMGSLEGRYLEVFKTYWWLYILSILVMILLKSRLQVFLLDEQKAKTLGINVNSLKKTVIILISIFSALAISIAGPISMIGLVVPHISTKMAKGNYKYMIIYTFIIGAIFLEICDVLARVIAYPKEVPVGILTGLIAVIAFIILAKKGAVYDRE